MTRENSCSILGISAFYHDSAAALVIDGEIVAAAQEERFSRLRHDAAFPSGAVDYCLREAGIAVEQLDYVVFYDKPLKKFERLLETYLAYTPRGFRSFKKALPLWLEHKLHLPREIRRGLRGRFDGSLLFLDHHQSHAASAFFPSPYDRAAILCMDGVGEWATTTWGIGEANRIRIEQAIAFPHSLGLLYSAFTYFTGFQVNSGEYKLMGLAPYGQPIYVERIKDNLIDIKPDGSYRLALAYFDYCAGLHMTGAKFHELFDGPPRRPEAAITQRELDLAASIQAVLEEVVLLTARHVHARTAADSLCLAGGVALNCVANGRLLREGPFKNIWVQPAAGDAGGALGAALFAWHQLLDHDRVASPRAAPPAPRASRPAPRASTTDKQRGSLLGPAYAATEIRACLDAAGASYREINDEAELLDCVVEQLCEGRVVGWFQGRMEFGPRALGSRSILADARRPQMQSTLNLKIKHRESFRPFAPCILQEHAHRIFDLPTGSESPYMSFVTSLRDQFRTAQPDSSSRADRALDLSAQLAVQRSMFPAITHVDYSARVQTVDAERHERLYRLLLRFEAKTGCPLLVNTSFNVRGEPIVATPAQAYACFRHADVDLLVIGDYVLSKGEQPALDEAERQQHWQRFKLD